MAAAAIKNRYELPVALFDVENGNPNGDPDVAPARESSGERIRPATDASLERPRSGDIACSNH